MSSLPAAAPDTTLAGAPASADAERALRPGRRGLLGRGMRSLRRRLNELHSAVEERFKVARPRSWPIFLNLQHTSICNLRCRMCQQAWDDIPQVVMERGLYRRIRAATFDRVSELSLSVMGDPFCVSRDFIDEILRDVEDYGLRLEITTNATRLGDEAQVRRLARLVSHMIFSFDGATKETFESIRIGTSWERVTGQIEAFVRATRELAPWRRPLIDVNYVLMRSTLAELPRFVELAESWGVHTVRAFPMTLAHESMRDEIVDWREETAQAALAEAMRLSRRGRVRLHLAGEAAAALPADRSSLGARLAALPRTLGKILRPIPSQGLNHVFEKTLHHIAVKRRECGYLGGKVYLLLNGEVSTCCHPDYMVMGRLGGGEGLEATWRGDDYASVRAALNSERPADPCRDCHLLRR
ncbi:MAG: radical SAM protein [Planctomycetota bacterium]